MTTSTDPSWYTRRAGQIRGPYPQERISHYILLGRIHEADELSRDGECWQSLQAWPDLIPEVMRSVRTEADRQRLEAARRQVDERSGRDRRTRRLNPPQIERRGRDRRRGQSAVSTASRGRRLLPVAAGVLMAGLLIVLASG